MELLAEEPNGARISDLAAALDVNKAIAFRLLGYLMSLGYAAQDEVSERYSATLKLTALGLRRLDSAGFDEWAQPLLDDLARDTRELVRLAVAEDASLRWIARAQGSDSRLIIDPAYGAEAVLHATATGKAWLATLPESEVRRILESRGMPARTRATITSLDELMSQLDEVRRVGYAIVLEEMDEGINAIAVAVVRAGSTLGAVSVGGPAFRVSRTTLESFAPRVIATAEELARRWLVFEHQERNA